MGALDWIVLGLLLLLAMTLWAGMLKEVTKRNRKCRWHTWEEREGEGYVCSVCKHTPDNHGWWNGQSWL